MSSILSKSFHHLNLEVNAARIYFSTSSFSKSSRKKSQRRLQNEFVPDNPRSLFLKQVKEESEVLAGTTVEQLNEFAEKRRSQMRWLEKKMKLKTIERKYFKTNEAPEPNLLTWDMKEHLIHLHASDPALWNPVTLSHTFPISQAEVQKLLQLSPKKRLTGEKLKHHDLKVLENWKKFKGEIGSFSLLKKTINKRISEMNGGGALPVPTGTPDDVISILEDLKFTPTDDTFAVENKQKKSRKWLPSFKNIITEYEERRLQFLEGGEGKAQDEPEKCRNLSEVLPRFPGRYSDLSSSIAVRAQFTPYQRKQNRACKDLRSFNDPVTFEEFKHLKSLK